MPHELQSEVVHDCGQANVLHDDDSISGMQFLPPNAGSRSTVRLRICIPPPQVTEQWDHAVHVVTRQSTGQKSVLHVRDSVR